jgi:hypothetical protein
MHGWLVPSECAMLKVTMIREGHEFKDPDYPDEEEGIEKLKDAKQNFIIWPHKDIILKAPSSLIVSPYNREVDGTPTSQNTLCTNDVSAKGLSHFLLLGSSMYNQMPNSKKLSIKTNAFFLTQIKQTQVELTCVVTIHSPSQHS